MHKNHRLNFCNFMLNRLNNERDFFKKILWTDESSFSTSGLPNRQNYRHWSQENPQFTRQVRLQGRKTVNVWCGLLNNRVIRPYFFDDTLTGPLYHQFLDTHLQDMLENLPLRQYRSIIFLAGRCPTTCNTWGNKFFCILITMSGSEETGLLHGRQIVPT